VDVVADLGEGKQVAKLLDDDVEWGASCP
jgi:hypothetical protein